MQEVCDLWIPGHVPSPNSLYAMTLRERISTKKALRTKVQMHAVKWRNAYLRRRGFEGPARVVFQCIRFRLLDDDNLVGSLKPYRDGLVRGGLLPNGDGPKSGYLFGVSQERGPKDQQGVRITITSLIGGPHGPLEPVAPVAARPPADDRRAGYIPATQRAGHGHHAR